MSQPVQSKEGQRRAGFVPGNRAVLDIVAKKASKVAATVSAISKNATKDKIIAAVSVSVEKHELDRADLEALVRDLGGEPQPIAAANMVKLDSGYWVAKEDIVLVAECRCERDVCVGQNAKVICIFSRMLSDWVTRTGLFWRCYDEVIRCPRCGKSHKRGHVGALDICERPFRDQTNQAGETAPSSQ